MGFKTGDKVKCSWFLYKEDNKYIEMTGTFVKYNKHDTGISYVCFGYPPEGVTCFTSSIVAKATKNQQLIFEFMR